MPDTSIIIQLHMADPEGFDPELMKDVEKFLTVSREKKEQEEFERTA